MYAATMSPTYSITTGIALTYLSKLGIDKQALGQERLYGVFSWALVNFSMGVAIDYLNTTVMYLYVLATMIPLLYCLYLCSEESLHGSNVETPTNRVDMDNAQVGSGVTIHDTFSDTDTVEIELQPLQSDVSAIVTDTDTETVVTDININIDTYTDTDTETSKEQGTNNNMLSDVINLLLALFATPTGAMFTTLLIVLKMGTSIVENLVFLFFTQSLGSSNFVCGLSVVITVIFEVPIFSYSEYLLKKLGYFYMVLISCVCYSIRVVGYTLIPHGSSSYILFLEPLHGLTFGLAMLAATDYTATIANKYSQTISRQTGSGCSTSTINSSDNKLGSTAQAVMSSLQNGLGVLIGTGGGGAIEQIYGSNTLYRGAAVVVMCFAFIFLLVFCYFGDPTGSGIGSLCSFTTIFSNTSRNNINGKPTGTGTGTCGTDSGSIVYSVIQSTDNDNDNDVKDVSYNKVNNMKNSSV